MHDQHKVRVMLCSQGSAVNVTRVNGAGQVTSVIWSRLSSPDEGPFTFVLEPSSAAADAADEALARLRQVSAEAARLTERSMASLRWKQAAFVSRSALSAPRAPVAPQPAPDRCPKVLRSSSSRWLLGSFAAAALALVLVRSAAPRGSA